MWQLAITLAVMLAAHGRADDEPAPAECKCVPYYLCADKFEIGYISIINDEHHCPNYLDICCNTPPLEEQVTSTPPPEKHGKGCGIRNPQGIGFRITGETDGEAQFGEFPWMVAVLRVETVDPPEGEESFNQTIDVYQCGGSLIHPKVILTGAHCAVGKEGANLKIRAGEWDIRVKNEIFGTQDRDVDRVIIHESYNNKSLSNDVALLILTEPVIPAENIGFACLPSHGFYPDPGTQCLASGWGKTPFGNESQYQETLKKIELSVISNEECQALLRKTRLGNRFKLHNSFMCAGGEKGKDTCKGDGGSPLVCPLQNSPNQYIQSGLVAWGIGCGENQTPGVYANIALFRNWIDAKMTEAELDGSYYSY